MSSDVVIAFERELDAIAHDPSFRGVEIVQRTAHVRRAQTLLRVTIDTPGGVDLALCERIAHRLNASLDPLAAAYALEVESAGLERPLLRPDDYTRFVGKRARVMTTLPIGGAKTHRGVLVGLRGETLVMQTESGELLVPLATIKSAHLEYDPRADLQRSKRERKTHA